MPFEVIRCEDDPVTAFAYAARLADLIIVSRSGGLAGDLALRARAPVLALAETPLKVPVGTACIGWDGGEQAAAALRAAAPLLAQCSSVKLICVVEKEGGFPPQTPCATSRAMASTPNWKSMSASTRLRRRWRPLRKGRTSSSWAPTARSRARVPVRRCDRILPQGGNRACPAPRALISARHNTVRRRPARVRRRSFMAVPSDMLTLAST
ncbi:hypothetical protein ACFSLT_05385 [Novosphingobium resinovorum]